MYNFPFLIGNTSSIRVHLPASYVRLPECLLYPHGKVQYVFFNIHASYSLSTRKTTYILLSNLHSVDFLIDRRIYRFQNPPSSCNFGTWWGIWAPGISLPKNKQQPFQICQHKSLTHYNLDNYPFPTSFSIQIKPQEIIHKIQDNLFSHHFVPSNPSEFHFQQIFLRLMRSTHASTRVNHGIETADCRRDVPPPHVLQMILSFNAFTTWELGEIKWLMVRRKRLIF